ncbi:MAG TPA: exopolysaccharide biosynthesis polyprenyl glycosylphosphotransferase [Myxococcales bacterium]
MPQFSGHWYSGRAARLVFVEMALVGMALFISGQNAAGWREVAALVGAAACVPVALYLADLYDPQVMRNDRSRGASVLKALGFAMLAAAIFGLLGGHTLPRGALVDTLGLASVGVLLARAALVARFDERGHNRVLVIGAGQRAAEIERIVRTEAYGEYEVAGKLDPSVALDESRQVAAAAGGDPLAAASGVLEQARNDDAVTLAPVPEVVPSAQLIVGPGGAPAHIQGPLAEAKVAAFAGEKPLAPVVALPTAPHPAPTLAVTARSLTSVVGDLKVDTVVIASDERRSRLPVEEFIRLRLAGVTVLPAQRFAERVLRRIPISLLRPSDLAIGEGLNSPVTMAAKRVFDLVMSSLLLLFAAPVLALLAIAIKLDSEGPVFYFQERVGRGGKVYRLHKLRTMRKDAETLSGPVWASRKDPRVTRIGAFLRRTRLDEIPQVFAVFRGDMSFVGPRPERPFFVQQLKTQIPFYGLREAVKPGITGWAQIRYPYGSSVDDARAKLEYDLYYVQHQSFFLDWAICFHTVKTVLFGRGAR